jgi:hypothetical protein
MARATTPAPTAAPKTSTGLISSAARIDLRKKPAAAIQQDWQEEAWRHFDLCGELSYSALWQGNSMSRATLYVADVANGVPMGPTSDARALAAADGLLGGPAHAAQILSSIGVHLTVPGDLYVIGETPATGGPDEWTTASTTELKHSRSKGWTLDQGEGARTLDVDRTILIRLWQSHPRKRWEAYSPTRSVLPVLAELEQLSQRVAADLDSRLAGAGILAVAKGATFPPVPEEVQARYPGLSPLAAMLTDAMITPLGDRSDASAIVPIILELPGERMQDAIHWLNFYTELSEQVQAAREKAIRRMALGMDMEPEALLGLGGINHWGAWQIDEAGVKLHIEPKLTTVVAGLNKDFYRPNLIADGIDPDRYCLWFDTSELTTRPDQSGNAKDAHAAGELGGDALLRYLGLDANDRAKPEEKAARLFQKIIETQPATAAQLLEPLMRLWKGEALPALPVLVVPSEPATAPVDDVDPADAEDGPPALPAGSNASASLDGPTMTAHLAVRRALELAGNRMLVNREIRAQLDDVPAAARYLRRPVVEVAHQDRQLAGVWSSLEEDAPLVGLDPEVLAVELDAYTRGLLASGEPHRVEYLRTIVVRARATA